MHCDEPKIVLFENYGASEKYPFREPYVVNLRSKSKLGNTIFEKL